MTARSLSVAPNWAADHVERLRAGFIVKMTPVGNSMFPLIRSGQQITMAPLESRALKAGDIVLVDIRGRTYVHLIHEIDKAGMLLIGNNRGRLNGWVSRAEVHGIRIG